MKLIFSQLKMCGGVALTIGIINVVFFAIIAAVNGYELYKLM